MAMETVGFDAKDDTVLEQLEVLVVIFSLRESRLKVLLKAQAGDLWALPGRPVRLSSSLEQAAAEELDCHTGVADAYLEQLYTYGDPERISGRRLISVAYFALIPADAPYTAGEAYGARWFAVDDLPPLAMDHAEIIAYALRRLRYKLEYSAVGFQLLPETFTLSEIQRTYEMILGEKIDKRNFRRRILAAGIIEPTPALRTGEGRPARLYRYRPDAVAEVKARRLFP
jgi:8-oxo-dGTP diphosphatase